MSVEFEMLRSFNNNYELLRYKNELIALLANRKKYRCSHLLDKKKQKLTNMKFDVGNIENRNKIYF